MVKQMIYKLRDEGKTIVMSLHEMHQVEEMANRLLMIDRGQRVLYGSVAEVRQEYAENAVIVSGDGDWQALKGVRSVKTDDAGRSYTLTLDDYTRPDDILRATAASSNYRLRSFALAVPSLNDIFILVARHDGSANGGGATHEPS